MNWFAFPVNKSDPNRQEYIHSWLRFDTKDGVLLILTRMRYCEDLRCVTLWHASTGPVAIREACGIRTPHLHIAAARGRTEIHAVAGQAGPIYLAAYFG